MGMDGARVDVEFAKEVVAEEVVLEHALDGEVEDHGGVEVHHGLGGDDLRTTRIGFAIAVELVDLGVPSMAREIQVDGIDDNDRVTADFARKEIALEFALEQSTNEKGKTADIGKSLGIKDKVTALLSLVSYALQRGVRLHI
jgi:hypothetical protein